MNIDFLSGSPEDTRHFAVRMANESLPRGSVIVLYGEVGSGKTTFVRGFASHWGMENLVTSPTFTLMNVYRSEQVKILHFDLYRLNAPEEAVGIGIEDFISDSDYSFIEWPEIALPVLNFPTVEIRLAMGGGENERTIRVDYQDR